MFGVRLADGWVERSTSSGSFCVDSEEVVSVAGSGSFYSMSNVLDDALRLEIGQADTKHTW